MTGKLSDYIGVVGRLHQLRDNFNEWWTERNDNNESVISWIRSKWGGKWGGCSDGQRQDISEDIEEFSHLHRKKSRKELIRISAAVMGLEFSYAAETAFVSPTLLKIGVQHNHMTLVWGLSPLIGFFLTPVLGSLSDRCPIKWGRRRPFILLMAIGVFLGLMLVPNGESLGYAMGDDKPSNITESSRNFYSRTSSTDNFTEPEVVGSHPWGVFFTILGTVLLDFDADACQSPARAYLLDVTIPDDHARGLSTFTVMAGLGGFMGYGLGGINWDVTTIGLMLGGHVHAVFTLITFIFIICVTYTVTSFNEIPLCLLENVAMKTTNEGSNLQNRQNGTSGYGTSNIQETNFQATDSESAKPKACVMDNCTEPSFYTYLKSIFCMPKSIRIVCLTNLFCWMAHVCYSLYFTDFVGEAVFHGIPTAPEDSLPRQLYEEGVRFGCWGMSMYSLSCACYSLIIEKLIGRFGAKSTYVGGLLFYSAGMLLMAITKHKFSVIIFSWTAGVMYSTLFTMPYLLIANYHSKGTFELSSSGSTIPTEQLRGLGTDVAIVSSMVFLAQFMLSMAMGTIVSITGTTTAVVSVASMLALCGAVSATQIMYLDL